MGYSTINPEALLAGFTASGGWYDEKLIALAKVPDMGIGAISKADIQVGIDRTDRRHVLTEVADGQDGTPLFRIPPNCILSPYTSELRNHLGSEWEGLDSWAQLIVVMMWEAARPESPWSWYLCGSPLLS